MYRIFFFVKFILHFLASKSEPSIQQSAESGPADSQQQNDGKLYWRINIIQK